MKKLFLSLASILLLLPIAGCSTSSDKAVITSLNNQLDRVQSIVSSTNSTEVNRVSPYVSSASQENPINSYKAEAYSNMANEEALRQEVLALNGRLKDSTHSYKLGKYKASAITNLTNNLSKYLNYLNNTKPDIKNNVNRITKNDNSSNQELLKSAYITLSNTMNERYIYLENIYCSLSQIDEILSGSQIIDQEEDSQTQEQESTPSDDQNTSTTLSRIRPNIDTYYYNKLPRRDKEENINENEIENTNQYTSQPQIPNNTLPYNTGYNNMPGYNMYNPYYRFGRVNPNRNTDTFYPYMRNIDTYYYPPNYNGQAYGGYNQTPYLSQTPPQEEGYEDENQTIQEEGYEENEIQTLPLKDEEYRVESNLNTSPLASKKEEKRQVI